MHLRQAHRGGYSNFEIRNRGTEDFGLTTARLLKRVMPGVPLILFTGHRNLFKSNEASSAGIDAVFSKTEPIEESLDKAKRLVKKGMA